MKKLILLLFVVFLISSVAAIGVAPANTAFNYDGVNLNKEVIITVINTGNTESNIVLAAQGELGDFVSFSEKSFTFSPGQKEKSVSYSVNLPSGLAPGIHSAEIIILELPAQGSISQTYVGAAVAVLSELQVFVPYPGRFAEGRLIVDRLEEGSLNFVIPVILRGEFELQNVGGSVEIFNLNGQKVETLQTNSVNIKPGERQDVFVNWAPTVGNGNYNAIATISYGGDKPIVAEQSFSVGEDKLVLTNIQVSNFNLGDVAKMEMLVESQWSEEIKGVNIEMVIYGPSGQVVENVKTPSYNIKSGEKITMVGYWDTGGAQKGDYNAELFIKSANSVSETNKNLVFQLSEKSFKVVGFGYTISAGGDTSRAVYYLTGAIVILILINLSWFIFLRKRFTDDGKQVSQQAVDSIDSVDNGQIVFSN